MHPLRVGNPILAGVVLAAAVAALGLFTPRHAAAQVPQIYSYEETGAPWGELPDGRTWGAPSGVKMDPDRQHLWVLERCGDYNGPGCWISDLPAILKFDSSGNLIQSFGSDMFVFPHGLWVDHDANVWVADGRGAVGRGHQIFKFSPDGELLLTLGQPGVPGEERYLLNRPSDVAVAANGDIFVADGHSPMDTNMRIVKYDANGTYIGEWGEKGSAPGQLDGAHGLALDSQGRLFVADRGNNRVQIFDQEGNFIDAWTQFGSPSGLYVTPDDVLYVADLAEGIRFGSAKDGVVTGHIRPATPPDGGSVRVAESVTVDENGILYAGENAGMVLMRFEIPK